MRPENCPLVSILIPAYNHAAFVEECLASVAATDFPRLEILLVDDGSTDATFERVTSWRRSNPDLFERFEAWSRPNRGLNATLNELLRASRGEFICLLGSDDVLSPDGVKLRVEALLADQDLWAVFGDCNVIDEHGVETHESGFDLNSADVAALSSPATMATELVWRWSVPGPVLMARREAFFAPDGYGFYPEHRKVEDREFYLWALSRGRLGFVNAHVASYRIHSSNVSRVLSSLTEAENKEAEWAIAAKFPIGLRMGLRLRCFLYRLRVQPRRTAIGGLLGRVAQSLEWRITDFVLRRNSRQARLRASPAASKSRVSHSIGRRVNRATTDRGL